MLSRDPGRARVVLGDVVAVAWDPVSGPAPAEGLAGRDAVVHLAGENIAQRWTDSAKKRIRTSRELGTRNLVAGLREADPRPGVLVSASGIDYYGPRGGQRLDESAAAGSGFLADVVKAWEHEARAAEELGVRTVLIRTAMALSGDGGALPRMLPFFRAGIGGPVAGGRQYMPWIHLDDLVGLYVSALDDLAWSGPINACAPEPVTNREFSKALGGALHRPAIAPVPAFALRLLYGEMAETVTTGQRPVPRRALELGYRFAHPDLDEALASALR